MKNLKDIIIERLHITKDTCPDISNQWANINDSTKYEYDATYYFFELIKDKVCWDPTNKTLLFINFDTTLSADDLKELNKTLGKDGILDSLEWIWDRYKQSHFIFIIFKEKLIDIHNSLMHQDKYSLTLCGDAVNFYKKYYKDII